MRATLHDLRRVAEVEFGHLINDSLFLGEKLRLFLSDESYVDLWLSRKIPDRFGIHWERRHLDGTLYRYDNFPDTYWRNVATYPWHFHNGSQDAVEAAPFALSLPEGFREFMQFIDSTLNR